MSISFYAVEAINGKPGHYANFFRVSGIYPSKKKVKELLRSYAYIIDQDPVERQLYGSPENLFISEEPGSDSGFFAPYGDLHGASYF